MSNTLSIPSMNEYTENRIIRYVERGNGMSALAGYIRSELEQRGWSQNQLAVKAGLRESTISNLLNKPGVLPRPETLRKLAAALEVPEAKLTALAGYTIDDAAIPEARLLRFARLIASLPWLEHGVEKWLQLPEDEQEEVLNHIEFRLSRVAQKKRDSHQPSE